MAYIEQIRRIERFLQRIDPPSKDHGSQVEYEDNLWSFFQNAWHLKDWIKNDPLIKTIDIEKIIKKGRAEEPLLFLIDEIFRGTNSRDRTDGAKIVLKNLSRSWIIGIMSTHDYELC